MTTSSKIQVKKLTVYRATIVITIFFCCWACLPATSAFAQRSNITNTDQIDPVREGDNVEYSYGRDWIPATVLSYSFKTKKAKIEVDIAEETTVKEVSMRSLRFPNGEGQWALWKDSRGKMSVEGRFIARDEKNVMIRKVDGTELTIEISKLALNLKQRVRATPITGQENAIGGVVPVKVGDEVQVESFRDWHDGKVVSIDIGQIEVEYTRNGHSQTSKFSFDKVRFPGGEGPWEMWKSADGELDIEARYLGRDATNVTLLKTDKSTINYPIEKLSRKLKQRVKQVAETAKRNFVNGAVPVRHGDQVMVQSGDSWSDGTVKEIKEGKASIEYFDPFWKTAKTKDFAFAEIRYPNGEGKWREWRSANGKFTVIARYISRTKTDVTIRKLDGKEITIKNGLLSTELRRAIAKTPITGKESMIGGVNPIRVGDNIQARQSRSFSSGPWVDGIIVESGAGYALIKMKDSWGKEVQKSIPFKDIRYPNGEGHWRSWTDDAKSFKLLARYISRTKTHVTLLKEDDTTVDLPIDSLSARLKKIMKDTLVVAKRPELIEFETSLKIVSFLSKNRFAQTSLSDLESAEPIATEEGGFGFELENGDRISALIPTASENPWYALGTYSSNSFDGARWTRLYWTRPNQSKCVNGPNFQPDERIVEFSPKQSRLITVVIPRDGDGQPSGFCIYNVKAGEAEVTPEISWNAPNVKSKKRYGNSRVSKFKAALIGDNQLLLATTGQVSLYDFNLRKIVYTVDGVIGNSYVLHPSKKYFVVNTSGGLNLYQTATGKHIAHEPSSSGSHCGFSQDGKKLVVIGAAKVRIWDLEKASEPTVLRKRNLSPSSTIVMLDDKWIMAGSQLYNIPKEIVVWAYSPLGVQLADSKMLGKHHLLAATQSRRDGKRNALVGIAEVPHEGAMNALESLKEISMLMLKPGSGVKVDALGDKRIREGIMRAIEKNGWHEDPTSEFVISGKAFRGKSETLTFGSSRFGFSRFRKPSTSQTVTAAPWRQEVKIMQGEQLAWSTSSGHVPRSFLLGDGESVGRKMSEATKPSYELFENLVVPEEVIYPKFRNGLGRTAITVGGFIDKVFAEAPEENTGEADPR